MRVLFLPFLFCILILPLHPQTQPNSEPVSYIGLTLTELITNFGIPDSVYSSRGPEVWQDDVVFKYGATDFYIVKDRVWQIAVREAFLIRAGDPFTAVFLSFGEPVASGPDYAVFTLERRNLPGQLWPLAIRFNFDAAGRIAMIYIYRSDL